MNLLPHTPNLAFRHHNHWVLGAVTQWQHWPLTASTLPELCAQAECWQNEHPNALIVGGISYEQAALHHGLAHNTYPSDSSLGAFLGLVLPEQQQQLTVLPAPKNKIHLKQPFTPQLSRTEFIRRLDKLILQLQQAPERQANLAQVFSAPFTALATENFCPETMWQAWLTLMAKHAAPHACYINTGKIALLSASPELMLKANRDRLQAEPIKGSRPRGKTPEEDERLRQALCSSEKDLAENRMITQLQAKELMPLCLPNSVTITKSCELRRYSNVQHLVSTVVGAPKPTLNPLAALIACLPGASITGTPKAWAMEAIAELEPVPRGFYCGSFFHLQGNELVANVLIRTIQALHGQLLCHGGGGITALSDSEEEFEESCFKVAPLFKVWEK